MKIKICSCGERSLKGLKKGIALCIYHFTEFVWGREWADYCKKQNLKKIKV